MLTRQQFRRVFAAGLAAGLTVAGAVSAFAYASGSRAVLVQHGPKLIGGGEVGQAWFGWSVALSADGRVALVGGPLDAGGTGAVWVYNRSGDGWTRGPKLTPNDISGGAFGQSVALSADGHVALVGAPADGDGAGAVWVYTGSGDTWTLGPKLIPDDERGGGAFGQSVALSADGRTVLVGGHQDAGLVGAAWVFTGGCGAWAQQGPKLTARDGSGLSEFGFSVALSADGDTALIGGDRDNDYTGAGWVFTRTGHVWTQRGPKLTANDEVGPGGFGFSVDLSAGGDVALIGAPADNGYSGAGWVFTRTGHVWTQRGPKLTPNDEAGPGQVGAGVALSADGGTALVGGREDASSTGAAWEFTRTGHAWTQHGVKLTANDETAPGYFGWSVALSAAAGTALIGGPGDSDHVGAAWVFRRVPGRTG